MSNTNRLMASAAVATGLIVASVAQAASPAQGIYNFTGTVVTAKSTGGAACPATAEAASGDAFLGSGVGGTLMIHVLASSYWPAFVFSGKAIKDSPAIVFNRLVSGTMQYSAAPFANGIAGSFAISATPGKAGAFSATLTTVTGPLGGTVKTGNCTVTYSLVFTRGASNKLQTFFKSIL